MTIIGPNQDLVNGFVFVCGILAGVIFSLIFLGLGTFLTGTPQPHCGVCICP
jgi:hypothetical protein